MWNCCNHAKAFWFGIGIALIVGFSAVGGFMAGRSDARQNGVTTDLAGFELPIANADSAVVGEDYSMATAQVSDQADGLIVLDHNSGLLQVNVLYPRTGRFGALFQANVAEMLQTGGKGGQYMLVTGRADFPRSSTQPAAQTVIYVLDTATGNYVCVGIPFDRVALNANRAQNGTLVLIAQGTANPVIDRDDLR